MNTIPIILPLLFITGILSGCQQTQTHNAASGTHHSVNTDVSSHMSDREKQIVKQLEWVQSADASIDARAALKALGQNGKPQLIAFSGRGKSFPGLSKAQYVSIKDKVTYRYAEGSGDIIFGPRHKALRQGLRDYVSEYNQTIYKAVLSTP